MLVSHAKALPLNGWNRLGFALDFWKTISLQYVNATQRCIPARA
jgi:hypothetical protein